MSADVWAWLVLCKQCGQQHQGRLVETRWTWEGEDGHAYRPRLHQDVVDKLHEEYDRYRDATEVKESEAAKAHGLTATTHRPSYGSAHTANWPTWTTTQTDTSYTTTYADTSRLARLEQRIAALEGKRVPQHRKEYD